MFYVGASGNDPKNDFELFLRNYAWVLCIAVVVLIILTIVIVFVVRGKKKVKTKKIISKASGNEWIEALGGKNNIIEVYSAGSRLSIKLNDVTKANREALGLLGVSSIVQMSDKITLVTNLDNQKIVETINKEIEQK